MTPPGQRPKNKSGSIGSRPSGSRTCPLNGWRARLFRVLRMPPPEPQPSCKGGMAPPQALGMPDQKAPPPPPHLRQIERQHQKPERDHPEAENGQKAENPAADEHEPERHACEAVGGQGNALSTDPDARHGFTKWDAVFVFQSPRGFAKRAARHSPVAQSVEQAAVNRWVAGSSPARGATPFNGLVYLLELLEFRNSRRCTACVRAR